MFLGLYGAGKLGRELCDMSLRYIKKNREYSEVVFIDDYLMQEYYYDHKVYRLSDFENKKDDIRFIIANGTPENRKKIFRRLMKDRYRLTNVIDETAIISPTAKISNFGVVIRQYVTISSNTVINDNVLLQPHVDIPHDVIVGMNSIISTHTSLGGEINIGEDCYLGIGSSIREGITIGNQAIIGMGSVVLRDVDANTVMAGNPAKCLRCNRDGKIF